MGFFFFSSRRRHTRFDCDWSSDVCSSDLNSITLTFDDALRGPFNGQKSLVFRPSREGDVWGNWSTDRMRSEEHTSELQSQSNLVCRLLLEKKKYTTHRVTRVTAESTCVTA